MTKQLKEIFCHYNKQKHSPEMMVKAKKVDAAVATIYYWIVDGHLGLTKKDMLYPRKKKARKKQVSPNFKLAGKPIEERPEVIILRLDIGQLVHKRMKDKVQDLEIAIEGNLTPEQVEKLRVIKAHYDALAICKEDLEQIIRQLGQQYQEHSNSARI